MTDSIQTTDALKVGDTVYIDLTRHRGAANVKRGTVLSKSPIGVVRVDPLNSLTMSWGRFVWKDAK